jgi:aquaporin related protein
MLQQSLCNSVCNTPPKPHNPRTMTRLSVYPEPKESLNSDSNPRPKLSTLQAHLVAASGEFVGTFMFLYFSFACQIMLHTQSGGRSQENGGFDNQQNIDTALVYGLSLLVNVWAFFRISGGLFNPAVSFLPVLAKWCKTMNAANKNR